MNRVLIVHREHLLAGGIANLLSHEKDIDVVKINMDDEALLVKSIKNLKPTVVITDNRLKYSDLSSVINMLNQTTDIRLIVVDDQKNLIHIYEVQECAITQVADLVDVIRREKIPS